MREIIGKDSILMTDCNQVWSAKQAIETMKVLAKHDVYWIEEPTAPDDVFGMSKINAEMKKLGIRVATGEHIHNRILHKNMMVNDGYATV